MVTKSLHPEPEFTIAAAPLEAAEDPGWGAPAPQRSRKGMIAAGIVLALLAAGAAYYVLLPYLPWTHVSQVASVTAPPEPAPAPQAQSEPAIEHPIEKIPTTVDQPQHPLPKLDESDRAARDALEASLNGDAYMRLLVPNSVIRHIVATIDNLPRKTLAVQVRPIIAVSGAFATADAPSGLSIGGDNAKRYATYVRAAEAIDTKRLTGFYVRLYPLFQQAYAELGYPKGYFNDRAVGVIDHLLAAPEPRPPVYLSQPKVMYEFSDASLEDLSAGQKIMIRVGLDNEMRLKAKLREIRKALTAEAATTHP